MLVLSGRWVVFARLVWLSLWLLDCSYPINEPLSFVLFECSEAHRLPRPFTYRAHHLQEDLTHLGYLIGATFPHSTRDIGVAIFLRAALVLTETLVVPFPASLWLGYFPLS